MTSTKTRRTLALIEVLCPEPPQLADLEQRARFQFGARLFLQSNGWRIQRVTAERDGVSFEVDLR